MNAISQPLMSGTEELPTPHQEIARVVVLEPRREVVTQISQEDLEEILFLARQMYDLKKLWEDKRRRLRERLLAGYKIQPGVHIAYLSPFHQERYEAQSKNSERLIVR